MFHSHPTLLLLLALCVSLAGCPSGEETASPSPEETPKTEEKPTIPPVEEPKPAPDFELETLDGQTFKLSEAKGPVALLFWASSVKPSYLMIPVFDDLLAAHPEWTALGISLDQGGKTHVRQTVETMKPTFPTALFKLEVLDAYGNIRRVPTVILIDRKGTIRYQFTGYEKKDFYEPAFKKLK